MDELQVMKYVSRFTLLRSRVYRVGGVSDRPAGFGRAWRQSVRI